MILGWLETEENDFRETARLNRGPKNGDRESGTMAPRIGEHGDANRGPCIRESGNGFHPMGEHHINRIGE